VLFRGESLTPLQALGATTATVGVILTGVAFDGGFRRMHFAGPGVVFAIVSLVLFAAMTIGSDIVLERTGWVEVLLVSRSANAIISVLVLIVAITALRGPAAPLLQGETPDGGRVDRRVAAAVGLAGVLDVLGLMSFAYGLEVAETWLVGLASSFGPAVTIVVAVALLGERLKPVQWLGLAGVLVGMIAIGLP
jgi:drug/metabolite transporter (DMT)-like permease